MKILVSAGLCAALAACSSGGGIYNGTVSNTKGKSDEQTIVKLPNGTLVGFTKDGYQFRKTPRYLHIKRSSEFYCCDGKYHFSSTGGNPDTISGTATCPGERNSEVFSSTFSAERLPESDIDLVLDDIVGTYSDDAQAKSSFTIDDTGGVIGSAIDCSFSGHVTDIAESPIFELSLTISGCADENYKKSEGDYSGILVQDFTVTQKRLYMIGWSENLMMSIKLE